MRRDIFNENRILSRKTPAVFFSGRNLDDLSEWNLSDIGAQDAYLETQAVFQDGFEGSCVVVSYRKKHIVERFPSSLSCGKLRGRSGADNGVRHPEGQAQNQECIFYSASPSGAIAEASPACFRIVRVAAPRSRRRLRVHGVTKGMGFALGVGIIRMAPSTGLRCARLKRIRWLASVWACEKQTIFLEGQRFRIS